MVDDGIERVRRFNRLVTQRVGALDDHYLSRQRPLGASRVLWEIGADGCDVRSIRSRLDMDSGYLSRLLRLLESEHLVTIERHPGDQRVRLVRLTAAGCLERAEIDRRSDELAHSLLVSLDDASQQKLLDAMHTVERMLTAGLVDVRVEDPRSAAAKFCIDSYFDEIDERFDEGFDPAVSTLPDAGELVEPYGLLLVARLHDQPVACGGLVFHGDEGTDVKRMWVSATVRGLGLGRRMLSELELHASQHGVTTLRLETNRKLVEAIQLYRSSGYVEVAAFNEERYADHWFEKPLTGQVVRRSSRPIDARSCSS
ncbi:MAG: bifunctional helix-turn-helix transcriptional regulator/GNAT family N-acetyltransferase [Ilumatobacteraceae bacterium]